ncbi:MAG: hypothetical protein ACLQJ7_14935 [Syntrophobacteraceae bacterium]
MGLFYVRFMDDILVLSPTGWQWRMKDAGWNFHSSLFTFLTYGYNQVRGYQRLKF